MHQLRHHPPSTLGTHTWQRVRDYATHEIRDLPGHTSVEPLPAPTSDLLIFEALTPDDVAVSLAVRPSGTEPKIKFYGFARQTRPGTGDTHVAISQLHEGLQSLLENLIS
tara:strand:- start:43 stop:372 length:330 start_codon:yes stop_codon:yes gene_type:complete